MRAVLYSCALLAATLLVGAPPPPTPPSAAAKSAARSALTRARIDALFRHRLKPTPLPIVLPNPFQVVGGSISRSDDGADGEPVEPAGSNPALDELPPGGHAEALARYAAALRIAGTIRLNDRLQLIINQVPRKEGDYVFVETKAGPVYLQIIRIAPGELTLGYNDAVQIVRFKN